MSPTPEKALQQTLDARRRGDVGYLLNALASPDLMTRRVAARALGELMSEAAITPLLRLVKHAADPGLRAVAVRALGRIGDTRVTPALLDVAEGEPSFRFRVTVTDTLADLGDRSVVPFLESVVVDRKLGERLSISRGEARRTRYWAARRLADLCGVDALPALERAKSAASVRERWQIRKTARQLRKAAVEGSSGR